MKVKNILVLILSIIFIIYSAINLFIPKLAYKLLIILEGNGASEMMDLSQIFYIVISIIFIIVIIDLIIDLWINKKFVLKKLSLVVISIFVFMKIFESPMPFIYEEKKNTYRLDEFLTYVDYHSNENDFEGNRNVGKYMYIPILKKIIIIEKGIRIVDPNDKRIELQDTWFDES